jgi:hypothetical protein
MKNYVKIPDVNIGTLQNVEETEEYAKTVTEKQKRV